MRVIQTIFSDTFVISEKEATDFRNSGKGKKTDYKTLIICVTVAFCLTMNKYIGDSSFLSNCLADLGFADFRNKIFLSRNSQLYTLAWWAMVLCFFYFVFPAIIIKLFFREKLRDYGLKFSGAFKDYHFYIFMLVIMIPLVLFFSGTESFQEIGRASCRERV